MNHHLDDPQLYKALFTELSEGFALHRLIRDASGRAIDYEYIEVNPAFLSILGLEREAVIGHPASELFPDLEPFWLEHFSRVVDQGGRERLENYSPSIGKHFAVLIYSAGDELFATIFQDVSNRVRREEIIKEQKERLDFALRATNDGLWDWNIQTDEIHFSPRWKSMLGYTEEEIPDQFSEWERLLHPEDTERVWAAFYAYQEGRSPRFEVEFRMRHKNGGYVPILSRAEIHRNPETGEAVRMIGTHFDLSVLHQHRREVDAARLKAEEASQAKSLFLANISHELRTPLNGVLGMANLLEELLQTEEQRELLGMISYSAENLNRIIHDLLDLNRIESGKVELKRDLFDPVEIAERSLELARHGAVQKQIELEASLASDLGLFYGDRVRVAQIMGNLLTNALKYTEQGRVRLLLKRDDDTLVIQVSDTGIGIPDDQLESIFESFQQLENPYTKQHGGLGLGLAIVKQLVDMHAGSILVESRENEGSLFTVKLPWEEASERIPAPLPFEDYTEDQEARILVVEDEAINRIYIRALMERYGYSVDEARNGLEAVEKWRDCNCYQLVLMDIGMPKMDGNEAIRRIRDEELSREGSRTPIIALTAHAYQEDRERSVRLGADGYVTKPINETDLIRCIRRIIKSGSCESCR